MMTPDKWSEVEELFAAAIEAPDGERDALLEARCSGRADLRGEVETLLAAHLRARSFMSPVTMTGGAPGEWAPPVAPGVGDMLGEFRLVEQIGEGGMGQVYRAERADGGFEQHVAVKVIASPLTTAHAARRFRTERQILASLRHPNIVSLLDGRVTPTGHPFLVMEYVDGTPITVFCKERSLPLRERLELFRQVCSAVHHAHRHGIIHCDIKPANVLVTADANVKVLDFGVARLMEPGQDAAGATMAGVAPVALTPGYASPEQVRGLPLTTSSDVYALGVLLYETVSGTRPYETDAKPWDEVLRVVVETEPPRPSQAAHGAAFLPYNGPRSLRGDIDAIALRAMAKAPESRYSSAEALAEDIGRVLEGKPVEARAPSFHYVISKFTGRHRAAAAAILASFVLVTAAAGITFYEGRVAIAERHRAERRFNDLRQLAEALIFKIHDEVAPLAGSTPVRKTIVSEALRYLEQLSAESGGDRDLQLGLARAYARIGRVQGHPQSANLGDREGAIESFRKAQALLKPMATATPPAASEAALLELVETTKLLSQTLAVVGRRPEATKSAGEAVLLAETIAAGKPGDARALASVAGANFTAALAAGYPDSLPYWQAAGRIFDKLLAEAPEDPVRQRNVALVEKYLGGYYEQALDYKTALPHHLRATALDERRLARDPENRLTQFDMAIDLSNVGLGFLTTGDLAKAAQFYERSLAIRQKLADSDPKDVLARTKVAYVRMQLGRVYFEDGRHQQAQRNLDAAAALYRETGAKDPRSQREMVETLSYLGRAEMALGRRTPGCHAFTAAIQVLQGMKESDRPHENRADPLPGLLGEAAEACGENAVPKVTNRAGVPVASARHR